METFQEFFGIEPRRGLKALRTIELKTEEVTKAIAKVFGHDWSCKIMLHVFDVDPLTFREDMRLADEAHRQGLTMAPTESPRFNFFSLVSKTNSKLVENKTYEQ